jgi:hypothetical protein
MSSARFLKKNNPNYLRSHLKDLSRPRVKARSLISCLFFAVCALEIFGSTTLKWNQQTVSVDASPLDNLVNTTFVFKNGGEKPVRVIEISPDCACTTTTLAKSVYSPGESGLIEATLKLDGRPGQQIKSIRVRTDEGTASIYQLTMRVNVPDLCEATQRSVVWNVSQKAKEQQIVLRVLQPSLLVPVGVTSVKNHFRASLEQSPDDQAVYTVSISPIRTDERVSDVIDVQFATSSPNGASETEKSKRNFSLYAFVR